MMNKNPITLKFTCPDKANISATVFSFFAGKGYNILQSSQYEDAHTGLFFMRTVFSPLENSKLSINLLRQEFSTIASHFNMEWRIRDNFIKPRILIAVTKDSHCMNNLLNAWQRKALLVDIVGIVSNHNDLKPIADWYEVPFYHFPMSKNTKEQQEAKILNCLRDNDVELLVLARYMQILSNSLCEQLRGRAINIHHSFLPGFKGAKPYHQAHERGVKLIGATAHFVTADLDEGPIIEQEVERISHANLPEDLVETGRDIEAIVLNRAVKWYAEDRVLLNEGKTVVFRP